MTSISSEHRIVLTMCFHAFPAVVDKSKFTSDYSLQTAIVICLCASMEKDPFAMDG